MQYESWLNSYVLLLLLGLQGRQSGKEDECYVGNARQKGICKNEPEVARLA